jgi:hypothetical protein
MFLDEVAWAREMVFVTNVELGLMGAEGTMTSAEL